jgi:hypothetical protein
VVILGERALPQRFSPVYNNIKGVDNMDDKVQLSRETLVGDQVESTDIFPNTNTDSVNDDQTGTSLSETIERIWAAINNKVARVVNSVNGKSGIVVIDASDVGLENVDNVSFNDIKSWVIDELSKQFGYKQILLFDTNYDLEQHLQNQDLNDLYRPFYVERHDDVSDTRPYIGCIVLDPENHILRPVMKPINGIGCTDESLQYETRTGNNNTSGLKAGELRVKISSDEKILYVNKDGTDEQKGLALDPNSIGGTLHFYDGAYGTPDPDHEGEFDGGLISPVGSDEHGVDYPNCRITIDGKDLGQFYLKDYKNIHKNDIIVCNFDDYRGFQSTHYTTLDASKIYIDLSDENTLGTGYRVGDVVSVKNDIKMIDAKFTVTSIKDGLYEGPVASVNLLYFKTIYSGSGFDPTLHSGKYKVKPIYRFLDPRDTGSFSETIEDIETTMTIDGVEYHGDADYQILNGSCAKDLIIHITDDCFIPAQYVCPDGVDFELTMRGMCIGRVTNAPTRLDDEQYRIELNSVRPLLGNSLKFSTYETLHSGQPSQCIDVRTRKGHFNQFGLYKESLDVSGLSIAEDWGTYRYDGESCKLIDDTVGNTIVEPSRFKRTAVLPSGVTEVMSNSQMSSGGLTIMTDMSLCLQPHEICGGYTRKGDGDTIPLKTSALADNWAASTPYVFPRYEHETPSYVGVNLFKVVEQKNRTGRTVDEVDQYMRQYHFYNMSGLRVVDKYTPLSKSLVGKTTDSYLNFNGGPTYDAKLESFATSGGLMVNVGKGLDIRSYDEYGTSWFEECGKVCVRTDDDSIFVNDDNRLQLKLCQDSGLVVRTISPSDPYDKAVHVNVDSNTIVIKDTKVAVNISPVTYHDIDIFSNYHKVVNLLQDSSPTGIKHGLCAYVDTKYGLGFTMNSSAPHALKIRIKADDLGGPNTVYRSIQTGMPDDSLIFDKDGVLRSPIDTSRGLKNTYIAKAMSSDTVGNVEVSDSGGLAINIGPGLTFTEDGALTLDNEGTTNVIPLSAGYDLNNLSAGAYCAPTYDIGNSIVNRPNVTNDVGAFRVEQVKMFGTIYMQRLYSYNHSTQFYMRFSNGTGWGKWVAFTGAEIN